MRRNYLRVVSFVVTLGGAARLCCAAVLIGSGLYADAVRDTDHLREQAMASALHGSLDRAESLLRSGIELLGNNESPQNVVFWNELGSVHHSAHRPEAKSDFEKALSINSKLPQPDPQQTAIALNNLGTIAGENRDTGSAEGLLKRALRLLEENRQPSGEVAALVRGNMALTLQQQGRYSEAKPLYERASVEVKSWYGQQSVEYARLLTNLVVLDLHLGEYAQAVTYGRLATEIERSLPYVSPNDLALASNNLGLALTETGALPEAEAALLKAVQLAEGLASGKDQLAASLNNLAAVEEKQGRLELAREHAARVVALMTPSAAHTLTWPAVWNNLGRIAAADRDYRQAREFYGKALNASEARTGTDSVEYAATLSNLAGMESAQGRHKKAETLYRQALSIDQQRLGANHPEVASDQSNVATQLYYRKHFTDALEIYEAARVGMEKSFGPRSPQVARVWRNVAITYYSAKLFDKSVDAYARALDIVNESSASTDARLAPWLKEYGAALRMAGCFGEAETVETRALGLEVRSTLASQKRQAASAAARSENGKT